MYMHMYRVQCMYCEVIGYTNFQECSVNIELVLLSLPATSSHQEPIHLSVLVIIS